MTAVRVLEVGVALVALGLGDCALGRCVLAVARMCVCVTCDTAVEHNTATCACETRGDGVTDLTQSHNNSANRQR